MDDYEHCKIARNARKFFELNYVFENKFEQFT